MDDQSKDAVGTEVAELLESGMASNFSDAVNTVLSRNSSLSESDSWDSATYQQRKAIRDRVTSDKRTKSVSVKKSGSTYIQVDKNNYKKILDKKEDIAVSSSGDVFIRDSQGSYKELIHDK